MAEDIGVIERWIHLIRLLKGKATKLYNRSKHHSPSFFCFLYLMCTCGYVHINSMIELKHYLIRSHCNWVMGSVEVISSLYKSELSNTLYGGRKHQQIDGQFFLPIYRIFKIHIYTCSNHYCILRSCKA